MEENIKNNAIIFDTYYNEIEEFGDFLFRQVLFEEEFGVDEEFDNYIEETFNKLQYRIENDSVIDEEQKGYLFGLLASVIDEHADLIDNF